MTLCTIRDVLLSSPPSAIQASEATGKAVNRMRHVHYGYLQAYNFLGANHDLLLRKLALQPRGQRTPVVWCELCRHNLHDDDPTSNA